GQGRSDVEIELSVQRIAVGSLIECAEAGVALGRGQTGRHQCRSQTPDEYRTELGAEVDGGVDRVLFVEIIKARGEAEFAVQIGVPARYQLQLVTLRQTLECLVHAQQVERGGNGVPDELVIAPI